MMPMPGSRNGRATPGRVTWNTPSLLAVASFSSMLPPEGATTTARATLTRMPSRRSSVPGRASDASSAADSSTGAGNATPVSSTSIVGPVIWVMVNWWGLEGGTNSATVPVTRTRLPTTAVAGGAPPVNTNTPSEVAGSPSSLAACRKKPLLNFSAVTMPSVMTRLST